VGWEALRRFLIREVSRTNFGEAVSFSGIAKENRFQLCANERRHTRSAAAAGQCAGPCRNASRRDLIQSGRTGVPTSPAHTC